MKLKVAKREQVKLRIGFSGASGFGKTYSALLLAFGITNDWSKVAIIDTENNSANLYANLGGFNVLQLQEPYSPERYMEALNACENAGMEVVIIDSVSKEWVGTGGCLQIHERLGGRFQDWARVTPRHQSFIDAILKSTCHVITTTRRKIDYSMDVGSNGKTKVVKHGTKQIMRDGFEYELTVNFELINDKHMAISSKDRTGLFTGKPEFIINAATGKKLKAWCELDDLISKARTEVESCETVEGLRHLYQKYISIKESLHADIIKRKSEIENVSAHVIPSNQILNNK
ncbi:AAA family ATPase [Formosa sp. A9]|uniref:AAA family ATPase n=1 Tax=Formosa sp. A9 TaxID=3442641 RepID=UPI003EB8F465